MAPAPDTTLPPRKSLRSAFVLVEVLMAMTILGIASMAFLKSFTYSINAARKMEIITRAGFIAAQMMDRYEVEPPPEGVSQGDCGKDYPNFQYRMEMKYVEPNYDDIEPPDDVVQLFPMRQVHIEIDYDDGIRLSFKALELDTAIMGFEKFSASSKLSYSNY